MSVRLLCALVFVSAHLALAGPAEEDAKFLKLPPGAPVIGGGVEVFKGGGKVGSIEVVPIAGQPFDKALRITTREQPANPYSFQALAPTTAAVKKGDMLLGIFYARVVEPLPADDEARTEFVFELNADPHTKSASFPVILTKGWQKIYVPFQAKLDHEAGRAQVIFRAGYDPQTIEIAGVEVLNYGAQMQPGSLPFTSQTYAGREPDARWRQTAAERIEMLRKGDLQVVVTRGGKPVPGAEVHVAMRRHAFGFGTAIDARQLLEKGADGDRYRGMVPALFNKAVIENHLKWHVWEKDRTTGPAAVAWLREHGLEVRGHTLLWPGWKNLPTSLRALEGDPAKLRQAVLDHVRDEATVLRGQLVEWDVLNEPFSNSDLQKILGDEILADAFKASREADPAVKLDINDYAILSGGGTDKAHQDHYEKTIRTLLAAGAPVQGLGVQSHFGEDLTPPEQMLAILDRFGALGLPIQGTEHDINVWDETLQADFTRDYLTVMFSHPSVIGVLVWGFWEKAHWIPNAAYFRADWSPRPAGTVWQDLVRRQWWTDARGTADKDGAYAARGFLGDYTIEASAGGISKSVPATLTRSGAKVEVALE